MKKFWAKFKLFWRELGNVLTNVLCPFVAILAAIMEVCQLPISWVQGVKKFEYYCWEACGTKKELDKIVEQVDPVVDVIDKVIEESKGE